MHSNARKALLDKIIAIAEQDPTDVRTLADEWRWWDEPGNARISLDRTAAVKFRAIVEQLAAKPEWSGRFSEHYLDDRLGQILLAAHRHGRDEAARLLDELIAEQQSFATEQRVFIPISGLQLMIPELIVGRVTFREGIPADVDAESEVGRHLTGKVHAEFRIVAEPIKAGELGTEETRRALEATVFAHVATAPFGPFSDAVIAVESERVAPAAWVGVVSPTNAYFEYRRTDRSYPVLISSGTLVDLNAHGLRDLSGMLARETRELSDLEKAILRAVHWLAAAQAQVEVENRLLNLTTCLEALIGPMDHKTDPISGTMAEAVALILGSGYEKRKKIRSFVVAQYGARSGVSHGGMSRVAASDVRRLREIVIQLILRLLAVRSAIKNKTELFAWLERTRLSGPLASPGTTRTIAELRAERGLSFMQLVQELKCQPEELDHWERSGGDLGVMRRIANTLDVPMERIAPPPNHLLMNHRGHRFLLGVRPQADGWIAKVNGWDPNDGEAWPFRAVDPNYPDAHSPSIIATARWSFEADSPAEALEGLRDRIDVAMERSLIRTRLPEDPDDWEPCETSHS